MNTEAITEKIKLTGFKTDSYKEVLTEEALNFLVVLHEKFNKKRLSLLKQKTQKRLRN